MLNENTKGNPLKGKELLEKIRESKGLSMRELAIECGYYTEAKNLSGENIKRANLTEFYDEIMEAKAATGKFRNNVTNQHLITEDHVPSNVLTAKRLLDLYASGERDFTSYSIVSIADELMDEDLRQVNLSGLDFSETNLTGINLSDAILIGTDFFQSTLDKANLKGANLSKACFCHGSIRYSDLTDANLNGADLSFADFVGNNLTRTNLTGVNLKEAWSEHHPEYNWTERNIYCDTVMPDGSIYSETR